MNLLLEYFPLSFDGLITEASTTSVSSYGDVPSLIVKNVLLQRADVKNRNGRIYPRNILEREIMRYNDNFVKLRRALGELDHDQSTVVNLKNASHLITEIWWEGDEVRGNLEILDSPEFPSGRLAAGLYRRKIPVGISSRAQGSVKHTTDGIVVNEDLSLLCWDLVSFESTIGSNFSLNEGVQNIVQTSNFDDIVRDIICLNSGVCECKFK